jgi:3-methyladenine DNA glycosylase/8-oxoguanine DNA glycosylase
MSRLRYNRREAVDWLRASCPAMDRFIADSGPLRLRVARDGDPFRALSAAIIYQQLSGKAAATIHGRYCALFPDDRPDPGRLTALSTGALRGAGLSNNKTLAVRDLAEKTLNGSLPTARRMARMDDAAVIDALCAVRGVGPWTAQMYLIFNLGRPDVMPSTDLGVQKGVQYAYGLDALPDPDGVMEATRHLAPFRSAAAWYFWLAADTGLIT